MSGQAGTRHDQGIPPAPKAAPVADVEPDEPEVEPEAKPRISRRALKG